MLDVVGSISRLIKSMQYRQRLATAAMFLWSCAAQALSRGNGPRRSLHASAQHCEYNDNFIFLSINWIIRSSWKDKCAKVLPTLFIFNFFCKIGD